MCFCIKFVLLQLKVFEVRSEMATEPKPVTEDAKIDLFEDDDEFEEFEIDQGNI